MKFASVVLLLLFSNQTFADSQQLINFMRRECDHRLRCNFTGQLPQMTFEVNGRRVLAEVSAVEPSYVELKNIRVMSGRTWVRYIENHEGRYVRDADNHFCERALGEGFRSIGYDTAGHVSSPTFTLTRIQCAGPDSRATARLRRETTGARVSEYDVSRGSEVARYGERVHRESLLPSQVSRTSAGRVPARR